MKKKYILLWLPVVLWCWLIFYLSGIPNLKTDTGAWDLVLRKGAHITEFAVLFLLLRRAISGSSRVIAPAGALVLSAIFSLIYAASDEIHQSFVPTRGPSVSDVAIDAVGIVIGILLFAACRKYQMRILCRNDND